MKSAICFDLDNTLIDRDLAYREYCVDFVSGFGSRLSPERQDLLLEQMVFEDDSGYRDRTTLFNSISRQFPELELDIATTRYDHLKRMQSFVRPNELVNQMLSRLAKDYLMAVVSNGIGWRQREKLRRAELHGRFQHVLISSEVGIKKPNPHIFQMASDALQVAPNEILFVGDDVQRDILGAQAVGMNTCWVSRGRHWPGEFAEPDSTISHIEQLEEVLSHESVTEHHAK